jgi:biotin transport system substrate-specific component
MDKKLKGMVFAALFAALTGAVAWFNIPLPFTPVPITLQTLMVLLSGVLLGAYIGGVSMIIYLLLGVIGLPVFAGGSSGIGALLGPTGGYLLSYPVAAFVVGWMIQTKKLSAYLKYFSFVIILGFIALVFFDAVFKIGIMKLWSAAEKSYVPMVALLTDMQRMLLILFSVVVLGLLLYLVYYAKKTKKFSLDTIFAMFAGTLIIYIMGGVQGMIVTGLGLSAIFVGWVLPFIVGDTIKLLLAAWIAKQIDVKKYLK